MAVTPNKTIVSPSEFIIVRIFWWRRSAESRLLGLWVRILPGTWMFDVSVVCCQVRVSATNWSPVQSSPIDCDSSLCGLGTSRTGRSWPALGRSRQNIIKQTIILTNPIQIYFFIVLCLVIIYLFHNSRWQKHQFSYR